MSEVLNMVGGGSSNWTLLASQDFDISTTSTSSASVGNIMLPYPDYVDAETVLWVHIRDKAGPRNNYFYGSDSIFFNYQLVTNNFNALALRPIIYFRVNSNAYRASASASGVYADRLYYTSSSHYVQINRRYDGSSYGTIDGTFKCDVYKLTMPDGMTLFDAIN